MMDFEPKIGDLVWAKLKSYPYWPGRVVKPGANSKKSKKGCHWIYFFGSNDYAWIETNNIKPYEAYRDEYCQGKNKKADFQQAVHDIDDFIKKRTEDSTYDTVFESLLKTENDIMNESLMQKEQKETGSPSKKPTIKKTPSLKRASINSVQNKTSAKKAKQDLEIPKVSSFDENGTVDDTYEEEILQLPPVLMKPDSPKFDLAKAAENRKNKTSANSSLTFGFMGLGNMGSSIVITLINSGHKINLWNRSSDKCEEIKKQADINHLGLVQTYETPWDVVVNSDVIFSCLSDPNAAKELVIGNCGVIFGAKSNNALEGKGYVEMTSVDPDTSKDISKWIQDKGGRYLEAQIQGSKKQAEESTLIILSAGDKTLFYDCQSCFKAMGKTAYFLGGVGSATKMNLCLNMTMGICLAGLAESMVLAERCGLSCKDFLEIFNLSEGASNFLSSKGEMIIERNFSKVEQALEYMQKDLKMCINLSDVVKQNVPLASIANEIYKTARRSGYDKHDVSVVFRKMRH